MPSVPGQAGGAPPKAPSPAWPPIPPPPAAQPPATQRPASSPLAPVFVLVVAGSVVLLLIVALGGYFFVYPKLRGGSATAPAGAEVAEAPSGDVAPAQPSVDSLAKAAPPPEEAKAAAPAGDRESESVRNAAQPPAEETTSPSPAGGAESGRPPSWRSRGRADVPSAAGTSVPEPVSRPPDRPSDESGVSAPVDPAPVEPVPEAVERTPPSAASEGTETSQTSVEREPLARQGPVYDGPKRGVLIWTGEVDKGMTVVIEGGSASTGQVRGALPGVACVVRLSAPNVAVAEGPGPRNGYRRITLRFTKKGRFSVPVEWEVLH
ncbi:MAG: hypothetical protein ACE15E_08065 [Acidobacteriota bacterium]